MFMTSCKNTQDLAVLKCKTVFTCSITNNRKFKGLNKVIYTLYAVSVRIACFEFNILYYPAYSTWTQSTTKLIYFVGWKETCNTLTVFFCTCSLSYILSRWWFHLVSILSLYLRFSDYYMYYVQEKIQISQINFQIFQNRQTEHII